MFMQSRPKPTDRTLLNLVLTRLGRQVRRVVKTRAVDDPQQANLNSIFKELNHREAQRHASMYVACPSLGPDLTGELASWKQMFQQVAPQPIDKTN